MLTYPASTAALEAPIAAFNLSAISLINLKLSALCNPLPPDITILAVLSSGLSDLDSSRSINSVLFSDESKFIASTTPEPPSLAITSNEVGRIVITFLLSFYLTVASAFPA